MGGKKRNTNPYLSIRIQINSKQVIGLNVAGPIIKVVEENIYDLGQTKTSWKAEQQQQKKTLEKQKRQELINWDFKTKNKCCQKSEMMKRQGRVWGK